MTQLEAKVTYRWTFNNWRKSKDPKHRAELGKLMDSLQSIIAPGKGPEKMAQWNAFVDTIPGFHTAWAEEWRRIGEEMRLKMTDKDKS